jgi:type IV pilus biogenesis protein CpaD/CtpE
MTSSKRSIATGAASRWATLAAVAAACFTLTACGNGFMDDQPDTEIASGCVSGRLGCVTDHNIAMAVARPSDLATPRREQPRDSLRRDAVTSAYRQGAAPSPAGGTATGTTLQGGSR